MEDKEKRTDGQRREEQHLKKKRSKERRKMTGKGEHERDKGTCGKEKRC